MALNDAIVEIQDKVRVVAGVKHAPTYPYDDVSAYPFAVCYPATGVYEQEPPALMTGWHDLVLEIHIARKDLPVDVRNAIAYGNSVPDALFSALRNHTLSTVRFIRQINYDFGALGWTDVWGVEQETIGWRFTLQGVKVQDAIVTSSYLLLEGDLGYVLLESAVHSDSKILLY